MDLPKKISDSVCKSWLKLALYTFLKYTFLMLLITISMVAIIEIAEIKSGYPWYMDIIIVYLILSISAFWWIILFFIERKNGWYEKKILKITSIETDGLFGDYKNANQEIKRCYPKEIEAERNRIICVDENGKKLKVRIIVSKRKRKQICNYFLSKNEKVYITYGRLTKIVFWLESTDPLNSITYKNIKLLNYLF